jgi:hypothetical protein
MGSGRKQQKKRFEFAALSELWPRDAIVEELLEAVLTVRFVQRLCNEKQLFVVEIRLYLGESFCGKTRGQFGNSRVGDMHDVESGYRKTGKTR